ncbi:MAG: hypothetical protein M9949_14390 [Candidatus Kapabacteria bacterium]|nr:hypothetical protein [Candidatus Kapabacteria bacterium]
MSKNSAFSTKAGRAIADLLVNHIARTEPLQNWDECIEEIHDELCRLSDKKTNIPYSAILTAEVKAKLSNKVTNSRYKVIIQEAI